MKFISYMRPKGSHANSHTANVIAIARTYVTEREIPFKRRKVTEVTLAPKTLF